MATVTQMLDRISYFTGQRSTGVERAQALVALNAAYQELLSETYIKVQRTSYTFVAQSETYDIPTILGETPLRIYNVTFDSDNVRRPLQPATADEISQYKQGLDDVGDLYLYGLPDFETLEFFPNPEIGDVITIHFVPTPKELHESTDDATNETTPSMIPPQFHWNLMVPLAMSEMMGKDARKDDVAFWHDKSQAGYRKLQQYTASLTGQPHAMYERVKNTLYRSNDIRIRT